MKRNLYLILLSVCVLSSCFEKKKDDPQPATPVVTSKPPVLNGLYANMYMNDTNAIHTDNSLHAGNNLGDIFFTQDSMAYKQSGFACGCAVDTTHTNFTDYIYAHHPNGDFVEQLQPEPDSIPRFTYYQYLKTTTTGFIQYKAYILTNKTTIESSDTNTYMITFGPFAK